MHVARVRIEPQLTYNLHIQGDCTDTDRATWAGMGASERMHTPRSAGITRVMGHEELQQRLENALHHIGLGWSMDHTEWNQRVVPRCECGLHPVYLQAPPDEAMLRFQESLGTIHTCIFMFIFYCACDVGTVA